MKSVPEFYDREWSSSQSEIFAKAFEEALSTSYRLLGDLQGKKLLEIGCGSGEQACYFSLHGAKVIVIDISPECLKATEQAAQRNKALLELRHMNGEKLLFAESEFDLIYINSVLMHADQQKVLKECSRVLKKDGKLVVVEPLQQALLVKPYRFFSAYKKLRPHYATLRMFRSGKQYFSTYSHKEFYLFSSLLMPVFYLKSAILQRFYQHIAKADQKLLKLLPFLRSSCWVSVVQYQK